MPNTKILKENGQEFYPVTHASLIVGMENQGRMDATYAWDGTGTPDVAKIPAGVVVTYDGTNYTGTLAASADTAGRFYLVPSTTVTGEYDRYLTDATGNTITWKPAGTTAIPTPSILDNVTSTDTDKALSANQGKLLKDDLSQLEAEVDGFIAKVQALYDAFGEGAFWNGKPNIDWGGNNVAVQVSLANCTINNPATTVPLGSSYSATITPDSGNILKSVTCTMGGEPVTVVGGVISIANVTASFIITAEGINLDSVAYGSKTYREIFETNNWLGISPGFDNGSYSPMTVGAGTPAVSNDEVDSGTYALKAFGSTSQQIKSSVSGNKKKMYIACRVKVTRYVSGSAGVQYSSSGSVAQQAVTDWKTICYVTTPATDVFVFVGSWSSADLDCYVDTPVAILGSYFSTQPTLEQFTTLYETYVAIKKAA